ncbi:MAG TPA: hypothetical protein VLM80_03850 [Anaerolineales bacterium]|nr:hypothetical protein [Anaerolineales bacterium]
MKTMKIFFVIMLSLSSLFLVLAMTLLGSGAIALAASDVGPSLSIPVGIPADPNSTVVVPVLYASNGNAISSMIFSVDYSNTYLQFNPTLPFSITMNLPAGFTGDCSYDLTDLDGEIDCFVLDPIAPLGSLPDGVIASIKLTTGAAPANTTAPVGFSVNSPPTSFGNTDGQSVAGSTIPGSVIIGPVEPTEPTPPPVTTNNVFAPLVMKQQAVAPPSCSNIVVNGGFEQTTAWVLPASEYPAQYTTLTANTGLRSMQTGIYDPKHNIYSYSSARQYVSIPADATSATLQFSRLLFRDELTTNRIEEASVLPPQPLLGQHFPETVAYDDDVQMVLILDYYNNVQGVLVWTIENTPVWIMQQFDLTGFAGQTIQLYFGTYNNGLLKISAMYVDDVSLNICH